MNKQDWRHCFSLKDDEKSCTGLTELWHDPDMTLTWPWWILTDHGRPWRTLIDQGRPDRPWRRPTDPDGPLQTMTWSWHDPDEPWQTPTWPLHDVDKTLTDSELTNDEIDEKERRQDDKTTTTTLPILRDDSSSLCYSSSKNVKLEQKIKKWLN